jgi:hypothetical protein
MRSLLLVTLLCGCSTYFGDDDGSHWLPDAYVDPGPIDSGGVCPEQKPTDGEPCSFHQSGLSCFYDVECYCSAPDYQNYTWDCAVLYDAGV